MELREELLKLARQKLRYGYRRLHVLLERRSYEVNVKRVYRLYPEEGLSVRRKRRKRLIHNRAAEPRLTSANQEWTMDFIVDGLATRRMLRILSVVDAYTRECLALEADTSFGSRRVTRVLEQLIGKRGNPENVRSDNGRSSPRDGCWAGPRTGRSAWCPAGQCRMVTSSFHGRFRDECLNASWFRTLGNVREKLADWRQDYKHEWPHSLYDGGEMRISKPNPENFS